jgi:hypothetical protein
MKRNQIWTLIFLCFPVLLLAQTNELKISGWSWFTTGRVEESFFDTLSSRHGNFEFSKVYLADFHTGVNVSKSITEKTGYSLKLGLALQYPVLATKTGNKSVGALKKSFKPYLIEASIYSQVYESKPLGLDLKTGYFSVKTNPNSRNLGEYLFRSGTYFPYLISGFEIADKVKMLGTQLNLNHFDIIHQSFFISSETESYPLWDVSLSYVLRLFPLSIIDLGAGVQLSRIISVNEKMTTPALDTVNFNSVFDQPLTKYIDPQSGDTINATFSGTKLMARVAIDPKKLFSSELFGSEDLKIYGEIALLGVKNYPVWYERRVERMPVMFGFNFPAFKILDVLSLEVEYLKSPYANSTENIWDKRSPIPYMGTSIPRSPEDDTYVNGSKDDWKWSIYLSKTFMEKFRISSQFANDHLSRSSLATGASYEDVTQTPEDWYWRLRVMVIF